MPSLGNIATLWNSTSKSIIKIRRKIKILKVYLSPKPLDSTASPSQSSFIQHPYLGTGDLSLSFSHISVWYTNKNYICLFIGPFPWLEHKPPEVHYLIHFVRLFHMAGKIRETYSTIASWIYEDFIFKQYNSPNFQLSFFNKHINILNI